MTANNRLWILIVAVIAIAAVALGWFLGISPKLDEKKASDASAEQVEANNQAIELQTLKLSKDFANLPQISAELVELQKQLPPNSGYPAFLGELDELAASQSVTVTNVTFAAPSISTSGAAPAPAATPDPSATADPNALTNAAPAGSVVSIPVTLSLAGSFEQLQSAIGALQAGDRLFLVSGLSFTGGGTAGGEDEAAASVDYTVSITATIFVLTDGTTLIENAPTATPTPAATATPAP